MWNELLKSWMFHHPTQPNPSIDQSINQSENAILDGTQLLELWSRSLQSIINIQSNSTVAENRNSCALCVETNFAIIAKKKKGRWQQNVLTFFLSNLLKKLKKIHPFSHPDASYSWRFHHPTQSIHPKMQCLMPQQIWSRDQEVFKTLQNNPIPQWQWHKFVWTLCTTNSATADNRGREGERKRERESKQASHPLMYLLSPPNEQIHPFKSPQVAHLMWSELLMEGSNFHHLTQHTHNQSQMATLDATACLVNWHRRVFKSLETSEFRSDSDTTTVWALHTTLSAIPVNRGRERERGEVGGSEINVPSFLPFKGRQEWIIV